MPNPREFLRAFQLSKHAAIGEGNVISKLGIKHIVVERFKRYTFPLTVEVVSPTTSSIQILNQFKEYVDGHRVVNSQYGNPYDCFIQDATIKLTSKGIPTERTPAFRTFTITAMGYGNRIFRTE